MDNIFLWDESITKYDAHSLIQSGVTAQCVLPLWIGLKEDAEWMFPIEPLISISGKNVIKKRTVAKSTQRGTIKERWTQDDWAINISGCFVHPDSDTYPSDDVVKLREYLEYKKALYVKNQLLAKLGINQIVIESYSFPFSKGENVQNFTIDAVSDDLFTLFIDIKNV